MDWATLTRDNIVEGVIALLTAFEAYHEDVKVASKQLLAVYIGVKVELL